MIFCFTYVPVVSLVLKPKEENPICFLVEIREIKIVVSRYNLGGIQKKCCMALWDY
jgi:hypothetical protein